MALLFGRIVWRVLRTIPDDLQVYPTEGHASNNFDLAHFSFMHDRTGSAFEVQTRLDSAGCNGSLYDRLDFFNHVIFRQR
jgi:hypothetical protein